MKCMARCTGLLLPAGQVELPTFVTETVTLRVWLTAQLWGTALVSKVAAQEARNLTAIACHRSGSEPSYPSAHIPVPCRLFLFTRSYFAINDVGLS